MELAATSNDRQYLNAYDTGYCNTTGMGMYRRWWMSMATAMAGTMSVPLAAMAMAHIRPTPIPGVLLGVIMKCRLVITGKVFAVALVILTLVACSPTDNPLNPLIAKGRAETALQELPQVPGRTFIARWDGTSGGAQEGCGVFEIEELVGTSELSLAEVLEVYARSLQTAGWKSLHTYPASRSFIKGDDLSLGISDVPTYNQFGVNTVDEARSKFRTVYLISVNTPLNPAAYAGCRNY